jgi:hypothetical protein
VAKSKSKHTTPAAPAAPDDFTPPGIDAGPFDIPSEWLAGRTPAEWAANKKAEEAEWERQSAVIDRANNAAAIRHESQLKELRAIREAIASSASSAAVHSPPVAAVHSPPVKKQRDKPKSRRIRQVLQKLYPPDGKAPAHLLNKMIIAAVCDEFRERHWKCSDDKTIMNIVNELGRN